MKNIPTSIEELNFFKIDGLDSRYAINLLGTVWDGLLRRHAPIKIINGKKRVELYIQKKRTHVLLSRVYLMAFKPMRVSLDTYLNRLDVIVYDHGYGEQNLRNSNWKIPKGGIECLSYPGYYCIVGNPNIVVSELGNFKNYKTGQQLKITFPKESHRYPTVSNVSNVEIKDNLHTCFAHRLIALAFLQIPDFKKSLFINHIDGNKKNYEVSNLEFVNHVQNADHALLTGLRKDNVMVTAYNLITKEKRSFVSMSDCAISLRTKTGLISRAIEFYKRSGYIKIKPWLIVTSETPAPKLDIELLYRVIPNEKLFYKIRNSITAREEIIYGKKKLIEFMPDSKSKQIVSSHILSYTPFVAGVCEITPIRVDLVSNEEKSRKPKQTYGAKPPIPIRVTNLKTGMISSYSSTEKFAQLVGAKRKTIQRRALYNSGIWNGFKLEYLN